MSRSPAIPVRRRRKQEGLLNDFAYERVKRDILQCVLAPGSNVTETELASRHRLGKAPIRAALLRLRQEGLVRPVPRSGYVVAPVTVKDVQELFEFRLLLEPATARLAAGRIRAGGLRRLRALCRADKMSGTAFNRANTEFHVEIARAAGNERIARVLSRLLDEMDRLFYLKITPSDQRRALREHRLLIRALATGKAIAAEKIAVEHIEHARKNVMETILASPTLMATAVSPSGGH
ncbi:MAG: GntR family transcriptional regulator [Vicinamibacteria bacterium]